MVNAEYPPAHPGSGPWWESPWGWGQARPACGLLPRPKAAGAVPGLIPWGNDNLPERTDRALIVCS
ncbi:protein of unknown function [Methanoculleus bourgensis]|uniref:Uncharacterized protein n=1 Tax=Methanoculleus bourgensis TaxID=83986 RepID=A0A0X3BID3_9EURY|nr:protein of unknown function [Methanoculleus bourgensis]